MTMGWPEASWPQSREDVQDRDKWAQSCDDGQAVMTANGAVDG